VTQIKTESKEGVNAVQIGFGESKRLTKAETGHRKDLPPHRVLREFRVENPEEWKRGATLDVSQFAPGDRIAVQGVTKGKGFAGVVKRHGFHGSDATHGNKDQLRMPGSIGATDPAHVFKGVRMPGRMGNAQLTVRGLRIVEVHPERNEVLISGAVPGARNGLVLIMEYA
jgi:large subunit ribosomal protein L3